MGMILITGGETYNARFDLRRAGARWEKLLNGWLARAMTFGLQTAVDDYKLTVQEMPFDSFEGEVKREAIVKYREQTSLPELESRLARVKARLQQVEDSTPHHEKDYAFQTQPILIGHHSERRHRKDRERMAKRLDTKMKLRQEIAMIEEKIEYLKRSTPQVKGDAAARREERIAALRSQLVIGGIVYWFGQPYKVLKINKKTVKIETGRGGLNVDIHLISLPK